MTEAGRGIQPHDERYVRSCSASEVDETPSFQFGRGGYQQRNECAISWVQYHHTQNYSIIHQVMEFWRKCCNSDQQAMPMLAQDYQDCSWVKQVFKKLKKGYFGCGYMLTWRRQFADTDFRVESPSSLSWADYAPILTLPSRPSSDYSFYKTAPQYKHSISSINSDWHHCSPPFCQPKMT